MTNAFQHQFEVGNEKTFFTGVEFITLPFSLVLFAAEDLELHHTDTKSVFYFLNRELEEETFIDQAEVHIYEIHPGYVCRLLQAPHGFNKFTDNCLQM